MKKIIFLFLAAAGLPLCAMDASRLTPDHKEELAFWRFKYLVESFWPDMYTPNLSILEKRGTLLLLRLPWERKYTQPYREYENDFWGYLNNMVILSLLENRTQRKNFIDLRNQIGILMGTLEEDVQKRVGPQSMGVLTAQHHQQTKDVLLDYRPRILELLKDIKDPYKTVEKGKGLEASAGGDAEEWHIIQ
jgi:hypothetical protein